MPLAASFATLGQAYPWREASHPLLKKRSVRADGATVFGCSFGGHVLALLSHHIVHGEAKTMA